MHVARQDVHSETCGGNPPLLHHSSNCGAAGRTRARRRTRARGGSRAHLQIQSTAAATRPEARPRRGRVSSFSMAPRALDRHAEAATRLRREEELPGSKNVASLFVFARRARRRCESYNCRCLPALGVSVSVERLRRPLRAMVADDAANAAAQASLKAGCPEAALAQFPKVRAQERS